MCSDNCNNNGNCISYNNSYSCNCINNYIGKNCSKCNIGLINYRNKCVQCFKKVVIGENFVNNVDANTEYVMMDIMVLENVFVKKVGQVSTVMSVRMVTVGKTALSVLIVIREFVIVVYWVQENVFVIKAIQV